MVAPLIPDRVLKKIQVIADRSKRSRCWIVYREKIDNGSGGTKLGPEQERGPYACRLDPSGLQSGEQVRGGQLAPFGNASVALPLGVDAPSSDDIIRVETTTPNGDTYTEEFNVIGDPFLPSYAVELAVPVVKVGS